MNRSYEGSLLKLVNTFIREIELCPILNPKSRENQNLHAVSTSPEKDKGGVPHSSD